MDSPQDPKASNSLSSSNDEKEYGLEDLHIEGRDHQPLDKSMSRKTYRSTQSHHQQIPDADLLNLPFRTVTSEADIDEYLEETAEGQIVRTVTSRKTHELESYKLVTFKVNDPENPKNWSKAYKWWCTMVVALTCFVVAFNSAVITADIRSPAVEFGVSDEVALLSVTFFVIGFGVGKFSTPTPKD
jgi:hypothetical protein